MRPGWPAWLLVVLAGAASAAAAPPTSSCIACHSQLDGAMSAPLSAWERDVHRDAGLGCEACHGGDPAPALADDVEAAMSAARGFRASPDRRTVPGLCGNCHADAEYMKRFDPQARVDQLSEYRTSVHGQRNAAGDLVPAVCTDCHGSHGIRPVDVPDSPVYATNVPATCARCHADAEVMRPYGLPTDQYARYRESVHGWALLEREDTAAPACNDCHGNHGAAPPGAGSVANVCGQCHGREGMLFRASRKKELFDGLGVAECVVCHGNHEVAHPTAERFRSGSAPTTTRGSIAGVAPLVAEVGDLGSGQSAEIVWVMVLRSHVEAGDGRLAHRIALTAAETEGIEVDATVRPGASPSSEPVRRVAGGNLAATLTIEALDGEPIRAGDSVQFRLQAEAAAGGNARAVRLTDRPGAALVAVEGSICLSCHSPGDPCDEATARMYAALRAAGREIRSAEELLRRAEVAGMDVSEVTFDLRSRGTTAAVEANALIHSFDPPRLVARAAEARSIGTAGLAAANAALAEIQYRRRGLAISLVLVVLVLLGLFLKIRAIDRDRKAAHARDPALR